MAIFHCYVSSPELIGWALRMIPATSHGVKGGRLLARSIRAEKHQRQAAPGRAVEFHAVGEEHGLGSRGWVHGDGDRMVLMVNTNTMGILIPLIPIIVG